MLPADTLTVPDRAGRVQTNDPHRGSGDTPGWAIVAEQLIRAQHGDRVFDNGNAAHSGDRVIGSLRALSVDREAAVRSNQFLMIVGQASRIARPDCRYMPSPKPREKVTGGAGRRLGRQHAQIFGCVIGIDIIVIGEHLDRDGRPVFGDNRDIRVGRRRIVAPDDGCTFTTASELPPWPSAI